MPKSRSGYILEHKPETEEEEVRFIEASRKLARGVKKAEKGSVPEIYSSARKYAVALANATKVVFQLYKKYAKLPAGTVLKTKTGNKFFDISKINEYANSVVKAITLTGYIMRNSVKAMPRSEESKKNSRQVRFLLNPLYLMLTAIAPAEHFNADWEAVDRSEPIRGGALGFVDPLDKDNDDLLIDHLKPLLDYRAIENNDLKKLATIYANNAGIINKDGMDVYHINRSPAIQYFLGARDYDKETKKFTPIPSADPRRKILAIPFDIEKEGKKKIKTVNLKARKSVFELSKQSTQSMKLVNFSTTSTADSVASKKDYAELKREGYVPYTWSEDGQLVPDDDTDYSGIWEPQAKEEIFAQKEILSECRNNWSVIKAPFSDQNKARRTEQTKAENLAKKGGKTKAKRKTKK